MRKVAVILAVSATAFGEAPPNHPERGDPTPGTITPKKFVKSRKDTYSAPSDPRATSVNYTFKEHHGVNSAGILQKLAEQTKQQHASGISGVPKLERLIKPVKHKLSEYHNFEEPTQTESYNYDVNNYEHHLDTVDQTPLRYDPLTGQRYRAPISGQNYGYQKIAYNPVNTGLTFGQTELPHSENMVPSSANRAFNVQAPESPAQALEQSMQMIGLEELANANSEAMQQAAMEENQMRTEQQMFYDEEGNRIPRSKVGEEKAMSALPTMIHTSVLHEIPYQKVASGIAADPSVRPAKAAFGTELMDTIENHPYFSWAFVGLTFALSLIFIAGTCAQDDYQSGVWARSGTEYGKKKDTRNFGTTPRRPVMTPRITGRAYLGSENEESDVQPPAYNTDLKLRILEENPVYHASHEEDAAL